MKICKYILLALAGLSFGSLAARATTLDVQFSFDDSNGLVTGNAILDATPILGQPDTYQAFAGNLDITAPTADGISGDYKLFADPDGANAVNSPTGLFTYDDLVMIGSNPIVTNPGLLAFGGTGTGSTPEGTGSEINFFSSGANTYDLYTGSSGSYPYSYVFTVPQGTVSAKVVKSGYPVGGNLVAAPEPSTWAIMGSFLLIGLLMLKSGKPALESAKLQRS